MVEVRDVLLVAIRNPTLPATGPQVLGMKFPAVPFKSQVLFNSGTCLSRETGNDVLGSFTIISPINKCLTAYVQIL